MIPLSKFPVDPTGVADSSHGFVAAQREGESQDRPVYLDQPGHYRIAEIEIPAGLVGDGRFATLIPAGDGVVMLEMPSAKGGVPVGGFSLNGLGRRIENVTGLRFAPGANSVDGAGTIHFHELDGVCVDIDGAFDLNLPPVRIGFSGGKLGPQIRLRGEANMINFAALQIQGGYSDQLVIGPRAMFTVVQFGHLEWFSGRAQARRHDGVVCRGYRSRTCNVHVAEARRGLVDEGRNNEWAGSMAVACETDTVGLPGTERGCLTQIGAAFRSFVGFN